MSIWNNIKEIKKDLRDYNTDDAIDKIKNLCSDESIEELADEFVDTDTMDDLVRQELQNGDWIRVKYFLSDVNYNDSRYYEIDGYSNAKDVTVSSVESTLSDIEDNLEGKLIEEVEDELDIDEDDLTLDRLGDAIDEIGDTITINGLDEDTADEKTFKTDEENEIIIDNKFKIKFNIVKLEEDVEKFLDSLIKINSIEVI